MNRFKNLLRDADSNRQSGSQVAEGRESLLLWRLKHREGLIRRLVNRRALSVLMVCALAAISSVQSGERLQDLACVSKATATYRDLSQALYDGYVNIDLFVPGQGFHDLNPGLVERDFEVERPELLIYAPNPKGVLRFVAVEYAISTELSAEALDGSIIGTLSQILV